MGYLDYYLLLLSYNFTIKKKTKTKKNKKQKKQKKITM